ncbi:MAG: translation elongation factor Ts [Deferribacteres bacterium]|nr:translation elongation factor Ts [candidate division KSB1 bacterium]MCB9500377.1 translation elongation factor Ts [Deferribacteres bacterium]
MAISAADVKTLRDMTGAGMMDCKKALMEVEGDIEKAIQYLREKGAAIAEKKGGRATNDGVIETYVHAGSKLGVMVEINCETDFVAKTEEFKQLARDIAMQIAAANPVSVSREEIPEDLIAKEREIYTHQAKNEGKPDKIIDRYVDGKLNKFYQETALMEQGFVKDPKKSIRDIITEVIAKLGENITVRRFVRYQLGEEL